jgi:hypothetical protein
MPLDEVDTLHHHATLLGEHTQHLALLTRLLALNHLDGIALLDLEAVPHG